LQSKEKVMAQTMKQPALLAEDGATFQGRIDPIEDGRFRAECGAQLDLLSNILSESPESRICNTHLEAEQWINQQATARGFDRWWLLPRE
jgi:hypothetical protein